MASHPHAVDDRGVEPLLRHWGGEATSFWQKDQNLIDMLSTLGRSRVLEMAVAVASTKQWYRAGKCAVMTFARHLGVPHERSGFDLCSLVDLGPDAVLAVHTEGDKSFDAMARGYPAGFKPTRR
ncbi:hypothetical protein [Bradyrhizobium sp. SZCCHNS3002]|uniref:hypothetical protein n=1 Tax=Bradyrhizobium sp. SZCCHNS3002 TaxID=3057310 RepID=UPI0028EE339A|nr:hypothetical protein [Bradyrhizobium sp. SZCCHNS3002]